MEEDKLLFVIFIITMLMLVLISIKFIVTAIDLYKFRSCYDIQFNDSKCEKYKDY